jgi:nucleoside-diphosphate-sugar epimerase
VCLGYGGGQKKSSTVGATIMRIFLAGASGAIGRRLTPLLIAVGHEVTGTTRSVDKVQELAAGGMPLSLTFSMPAPCAMRSFVLVRRSSSIS